MRLRTKVREYERLKRGDGDEPRRTAFRRALAIGDEIQKAAVGTLC